LGYETNSQKIETPTKVEGLSEKKIVDVGCGDRFTVVLASEIADRLPKIFPKEKFNEKNLANIKERTKKIKDVLTLRKNMRNEDLNYDELYENLSKEDGNFEEKLNQSQNIVSHKLKKMLPTSSRTKITKSLHVSLSNNQKFIETSKNLINDINLSRIHKSCLSSHNVSDTAGIELLNSKNEINSNSSNCILNSYTILY